MSGSRGEVATSTYDLICVNWWVVDRRIAECLVDELDLASLPACAACLFELAWAIHTDRPRAARAGIATRVARWVWPEIEDALRAAVVELRMREVHHAEDGLRDVSERGHRGIVCRVVVERLAEEMATEMSSAS